MTQERGAPFPGSGGRRVSGGYRKVAGKGRVRRRLLFVVVGLVLALVLTIGGTALGYYLWFNAKVAAANARVPDDVKELLKQESGGPDDGGTNILLIGSDTRTDSLTGSQSDTIMIVHVDESGDYLSMLSLPRDLRVEVEGNGTHKLNWTYAAGGAALLIKTIQQVTGLDMDHYVELDLKAFVDMTDSLGGIYLEVDRPYSRVDLTPEFNRQIEGNLEPGYQLLDGLHALGYVRYRYDSNLDYGRMARQQRFLRALRQEAKGWDLGLKLPGLVGGFLDNAATDLGTNRIIGLARWGVGIDSERMRQVVLRGEGKTIDGLRYAICTDEQIADAVTSLLSPPAEDEASGQSTSQAVRPRSPAQAAVAMPATMGMVSGTPGSVLSDTIEVAAYSSSQVAGSTESITDSTAWNTAAKRVSFFVEAPTYVASGFKLAPRNGTYAYVYDIDVGGGAFPALVMLYGNTGTKTESGVALDEEFINVTETTWVDAPAAGNGREVDYNGTVFTVVRDADGVERIWWRRNGVLYWVSNSLNRVASGDELMQMAKSMVSLDD